MNNREKGEELFLRAERIIKRDIVGSLQEDDLYLYG
jgi:hypothetical protein